MASASQLLFLLLCGCRSLVALAGDGQSYQVIATGSGKPGAVCSSSKASPSSSGGVTVPLNHRYGPCSPVPSEKKPTLEELLRRDKLRADYIRRNYGAASGLQQSEVTVPANLGMSAEYIVTVGIGSPEVSQSMIMDTGSDVSWVRCHSHAGSVFDPSKSSTYSPFSCSSAECVQLGNEGNGCSNSQCQYIVRYGDGSNTTGTYSADKLVLTGSDMVKNFQFGCSHAEEGLVSDIQANGLMGLGGGTQSLVSQTMTTYGEAFSYCLPPTPSTSGFLTLGAPNGTSGFTMTRMFRSRRSPTYYVALLEGIAVDGKNLSVPPSVFHGGSLMDSGTVITRLPPTAYSALSSAFKDGMKQYQPAQPNGFLDTCFDFAGQDNVTITPVALVFSGGAVVDLDMNGIMYANCLAFVATNDDSSLGIIGNVQQRTFEVLYDVGQSAFGFRSGGCSSAGSGPGAP